MGLVLVRGVGTDSSNIHESDDGMSWRGNEKAILDQAGKL